jgi:hypothetical protein
MAAEGLVSERIVMTPVKVFKLIDPAFPADHDEVAASHAVSRGGPGCGCWVCVQVVGPRMRAEAARAAVVEMAARAAKAAARDAESAARLSAELDTCAGLAAELETYGELSECGGLEECDECDEVDEGDEGEEGEGGFVDACEPGERDA